MHDEYIFKDFALKLIDLCKERSASGDLYIHIHNFPDADAVASAYALYLFLQKAGINVKGIRYFRGVYRMTLARMIECYHIPIEEGSYDYEDTDNIIVVDCQAGESNVTINGGHIIACFDHHSTTNDCKYEIFCHFIIGSCSTIIFNIYNAMKYEISSEAATCLLFGLQSDTALLSKGVTDLDIDAFKILRKYADAQILRSFHTSNMSVEDLKAFSSAIANIEIISDLGMSYVPFDCVDGLIAILAEFMLDIDDLNVVIICSYREEGIKISIRSNVSFINAGVLIKRALDGIGDGGGHTHSAGGFVPRSNVDYDNMADFFETLSSRFIKEYTKCITDNV